MPLLLRLLQLLPDAATADAQQSLPSASGAAVHGAGVSAPSSAARLQDHLAVVPPIIWEPIGPQLFALLAGENGSSCLVSVNVLVSVSCHVELSCQEAETI